ncbi:hypothetical protein [Methylobacterium aquaticum]|uniref:hypothetical protein n=1 Tax=Methylobacterium aquaticum TaxID=270351 RepID=UPI0019325DFA|nr:hypothetical protein [Methylobacterium aquaticum]QRE77246.1 hypothetical protein F1D61_30235 [Methylobacterium aquaticum]
MPTPAEPRGIFVDALWRLDVTETKRRLALVRAACRAASIEAGGDKEFDAALARVDADLLYAAQRAVEVLATELAMHERDRGPPPDTPVAETSPPPVRGARLPRLTPRTSP